MKKDILLIASTIIAIFCIAGAIIYFHSSSSESVKETGAIEAMPDAIETAQFHLSKMESLLEIESPSATQLATFKEHAEKGLSAGQIAVENEPENPRAWSVLGNIYSTLVVTETDNSYEHAIKNLQQARQLEPENPTYSLNLAKLEIRNNNFAKAEEHIQETIRLDRSSIEAISLSAKIAVQMEDLDKAAKLVEELIIIEPGNPAHHYQLGTLELSRGNAEAAIRALETATQLDPNYANARYILGFTYFRLGRLTEAEQQIEEVLTMNTENSEAENLLKQIKEAQNSQ